MRSKRPCAPTQTPSISNRACRAVELSSRSCTITILYALLLFLFSLINLSYTSDSSTIGQLKIMSTATIAPRLPPELLLFIFYSLRPYELAQVCKANSHLRKLARPLFYRFATMTKFGLYFAGARRPYPFLDLPGSFEGFSDDELRHIASGIKEVHIPAHIASDCAAFCNLQLKEVKSHCTTLRIDSSVRILDNSNYGHGYETFPHSAATAEDRRINTRFRTLACGCFCHYSEYSCFFVRAVTNTMVFEKVVLRCSNRGG